MMQRCGLRLFFLPVSATPFKSRGCSKEDCRGLVDYLIAHPTVSMTAASYAATIPDTVGCHTLM